MLVQPFAKGASTTRSLAQQLQCLLCQSNCPHAVVQSTRAQPTLSYLKPLTLTCKEHC